jgi:hypothetical protein
MSVDVVTCDANNNSFRAKIFIGISVFIAQIFEVTLSRGNRDFSDNSLLTPGHR